MIRSVAIFGASSRTGVCVVDSAIQKGLAVRVLLNSRTQQPKGWREGAEVMEGDAHDIQHVKNTLEGRDAAIVLLGSDENQESPAVTCEGLKNIVAVMESLYIKVISVCFPASTVNRSSQEPRNGFETQEVDSRMAKVLESSSLHWVAVVVPCLTDDVTTTAGYTIVRDRATTGRHSLVSRRDLAAFLVDCLVMPERYQKTVEIASIVKR